MVGTSPEKHKIIRLNRGGFYGLPPSMVVTNFPKIAQRNLNLLAGLRVLHTGFVAGANPKINAQVRVTARLKKEGKHRHR